MSLSKIDIPVRAIDLYVSEEVNKQRGDLNDILGVMFDKTGVRCNVIGSGFYSYVISHPYSKNHVVKVSILGDDIWPTYAKTCNEFKSPYLPIVSYIDEYEGITIAVIEKLKPIYDIDDLYNDDIDNINIYSVPKAICRLIITGHTGIITSDTINQHSRLFNEFLSIEDAINHLDLLNTMFGVFSSVQTQRAEELVADMKIDNIMYRGTQLVFTDPIC